MKGPERITLLTRVTRYDTVGIVKMDCIYKSKSYI
jgi:hypothetical protein